MQQNWREFVLIGVIVALLATLSYTGYDRYRPTEQDPKGSSGYTWFVVLHDMTDAGGNPSVYELDREPKMDHGSLEFQHNGDKIIVSDNWSAYRMQNR